MDQFEIDSMIKYLIKKHNKRNLIDASDLYQEALMVVPVAMKSYKDNKNAALKTYVETCIVNRFKNLFKENRRTSWLVYESSFEDDDAVLDQFYAEMPDDPIAAVEFNHTMYKLLSPREYQIFHLYHVQGYTKREIMARYNLSQDGVQSCLHRICQRYKSLEESLKEISTQRRLTRDFLHTSDQAS